MKFLELLTTRLVNNLLQVIENDFSEYKKIPDDILNVLKTNYCDVSNDTLISIYEEANGNNVLFVVNGKSSKYCDGYDLIDTEYSTKYLVIFMDNLKGINIGQKNIDSVLHNSNYILFIKKIIELYMELYYGDIITSKSFQYTHTGLMYRMIPSIIACIVVSTFAPLTEDDVDGLPFDYEFITNLIKNKPIKDILSGDFT